MTAVEARVLCRVGHKEWKRRRVERSGMECHTSGSEGRGGKGGGGGERGRGRGESDRGKAKSGLTGERRRVALRWRAGRGGSGIWMGPEG